MMHYIIRKPETNRSFAIEIGIALRKNRGRIVVTRGSNSLIRQVFDFIKSMAKTSPNRGKVYEKVTCPALIRANYEF